MGTNFISLPARLSDLRNLDPLLTLEISDVRGDGCFSPSAALGAHPKDQTLTFLDTLLFGEEGRSESFL